MTTPEEPTTPVAPGGAAAGDDPVGSDPVAPDPDDGAAASPARRGPGRRTLLTGAALAGALAVGGGGTAAVLGREDELAGATVPEIAPADLRRFGFTVRGPKAGDMEPFLEDVRTVRGLGLGTVRYSIPVWESVSDWGVRDGRYVGPVVLDDAQVAVIADALDAVEERGLASRAMAIGVYPHDDLSDEEIPAVMSGYWQALASALAPRAPTWQILNEPDGSDFRTFEMLDPMERPEYVQRIADVLGAARDAIHAATPDAEVTTNLYGFPIDAGMLERWISLWDRLAGSADVITVDAYPETSTAELVRLVDYVRTLADRYGKPVEVGEIGVKTCEECFTTAQQATAYSRYLSALAASPARAVTFYTLRDGGTEDTERFGVIDDAGEGRPAFRVLQSTARDAGI